MKLEVFAVFDDKIKAYMRPFFVRSKGEAIRTWVDSVNDSQSPFSKHPEDYVLFHIGEYDESTGSFENLPAPSSCGVAKEFVKVID